jgi:hypothetical protein
VTTPGSTPRLGAERMRLLSRKTRLSVVPGRLQAIDDSDDLFPATLAEPPRTLKPLSGELAYLTLDLGVACLVRSVSKKSCRVLIIAGREFIACLRHNGIRVGVIERL